MNWEELKKQIIAEYDNRKLKSRARYNALEKVGDFLLNQYPEVDKNVKTTLPSDKNSVKQTYEKYAKKHINSAESSVINEIYNQLQE